MIVKPETSKNNVTAIFVQNDSYSPEAFQEL